MTNTHQTNRVDWGGNPVGELPRDKSAPCDERNWNKLRFNIVILLAFLVCLIFYVEVRIWESGYRAGQADAINGEFRYEIVQEVNEEVRPVSKPGVTIRWVDATPGK